MIACLTVASGVQAHELIQSVPVVNTPVGFVVHEILPPSKTLNAMQPKLWAQMNAKERAEIWPFLSGLLQRRYWHAMTHKEKIAMHREFSPRDRELIRARYISPMHHISNTPPILGKAPCTNTAHRHLSDSERVRMREQIHHMHLEIHQRMHAPKGF